MNRLLLALTLALNLGCSSSRPSYVRSDFESVKDVREQVVKVGRAAGLVVLAAAVVAVGVSYWVAESNTEQSNP